MGAYSIAEAKDRLSSLVKKAEEGEDVAITRHGRGSPICAQRSSVRFGNRAMSLPRKWWSAPHPGLGSVRTASTSFAGCGTVNAIDLFRRFRSPSASDRRKPCPGFRDEARSRGRAAFGHGENAGATLATWTRGSRRPRGGRGSRSRTWAKAGGRERVPLRSPYFSRRPAQIVFDFIWSAM